MVSHWRRVVARRDDLHEIGWQHKGNGFIEFTLDENNGYGSSRLVNLIKKKCFLLIYVHFYLAPMGIDDRVISTELARMKRVALRSTYNTVLMVSCRGEDQQSLVQGTGL